MRVRRIVIAGAGIGGLTAALALAARGHSVVIAEKTAALQPVGAGVQLSPNASRILIALGLRDALAARATAPNAIQLASVRAGRVLVRLPVDQNEAAPYWVIHRADLQSALVAAVQAYPAIELRLGIEITTFTEDADSVIVSIGAETLAADVLIAADGVASPIRQRLFPGTSAVPSGWTAWRGMTETTEITEVQVWMGREAHLVAYPVAGGRRTNLVLTLPSDLEASDIAAKLSRDRWPAAARTLIAEAGTLAPYPLATTPPLPAWSRGRVALLGDAAHAILPFAAQGAAMAVEDAAVLARCIDDGDIAAALARYAACRRLRVAKVAGAARQSGRIYHMGAPLSLARDMAIGILGSRRLMRRQDWIYDWKP